MKKDLVWKKKFFTIWVGQALSLITSSTVQYALIWYLTAETKSATVLSVAALLGLLPMSIFGPFIGSFVDRFSRKKIMIIADIGIALASLGLAIAGLSGLLSTNMILIALLIRAIGSAFHQPCLQAITPLIVPEKQLVKANGYTQTFQSLSLIISPALAAALLAKVDVSWVILLDVLGAIIGVISVLLAKIPELKQKVSQAFNIWHETKGGIKILIRNKGLFYLTLICCLFSIVFMPIGSLYQLITMSYFGGGMVEAGIVEVVFAVGMLIAGLVIGFLGKFKKRMIIMTGSILMIGLLTIGIGLLPPSAFVIFVFLGFLMGFFAPFFTSFYNVLIQEQVAPEYLGRVFSLSFALMGLSSPIGLALSGLFADKTGINNWFVISGIAVVGCAGLCLLVKPVRRIDEVVKIDEKNSIT